MHGSAMFARLTPEEIAAAKAPPAPRADKVPIVPVPDDAPDARTFRHPKHGEPVGVWPYTDSERRLLFVVARFASIDAEGNVGKDYLPLTYCETAKGRRGWRAKGIDGLRPLYRLPEIIGRSDAVLIVAEGEKAADAAGNLFRGIVATTPAHGAKSPHKTDWSPVSGRTVVIATDNDDAGLQFGDRVCELVRAAGATAVLHLPPDLLGSWVWKDGERLPREGDIPKGWDIADARDEDWNAPRVAEVIPDVSALPPYRDAEEREARRRTDAGEPEEMVRWPFRVAANGVEKRVDDKDSGSSTWRWFCSLLEVVAETRSANGEDWGRLLRIIDRDGRVKEWAMPMSMLAGDGAAYRERLLSLGVVTAPGKFARDALHDYISTARPGVKARCVHRTGWQSRFFIGFKDSFGGDDG